MKLDERLLKKNYQSMNKVIYQFGIIYLAANPLDIFLVRK